MQQTIDDLCTITITAQYNEQRESNYSWQYRRQSRNLTKIKSHHPQTPIRLEKNTLSLDTLSLRAEEPPQRLVISISIPLDNYDRIIIPDTGRWYMNHLSPISTWRYAHSISISANALRTPFFAMESLSGKVDSIGLIHFPTECEITIEEPASNRALNVHTRRLTVKFSFSPSAVCSYDAQDQSDLALIFLPPRSQYSDWTAALASYSNVERAFLAPTEAAPHQSHLLPYWCTWVDWSSDQVDSNLALRQAKIASESGFKNFILDDGWFGPGLDSDRDLALNIGDWTPDPKRFPELQETIDEIKSLGMNFILWYAPHAVGPSSNAFRKYGHLLKHRENCIPTTNETRFNSLCFRNRDAREYMVSTTSDLISKYRLDGIKFDLFNWIPDDPCAGLSHTHDTDSEIIGLHRYFEALAALDELDGEFICELKQDYATVAIAHPPAVVRAGDAPYGSFANLQRTKYINARGMVALNDYQTFPRSASPKEIAVIGLRMVATGIPAWGCDLEALTPQQLAVVTSLNQWYTRQIDRGASYKRLVDSDGLSVIETPLGDILIVTNATRIPKISARTICVVNGDIKPIEAIRVDDRKSPISIYDFMRDRLTIPDYAVMPGIQQFDLAPGHAVNFGEFDSTYHS